MNINDACATFFRAVSDSTRQRILQLLVNGELCVSDIAKHFDMAQPSISHHLDMLKRAGLVTSQKRGREVYYSLNRGPFCDRCGPFFRQFGLRLEPEKAEALKKMAQSCQTLCPDCC
jgi:DNA-binding transcriptional ArsR family regulator